MSTCNLINIQRIKIDNMEQELEDIGDDWWSPNYMITRGDLKNEIRRETETLRKMEEAACRR